MSLNGIVKDDYGYALELTYIDVDTESAADISGYTTSQSVILRDPGGNSATKTAAFKTDGSDGVVTYTVADGDIDEEGTWNVRVQVESGAGLLTSLWEEFYVAD